jgi:hypothetical protein
MISPKVYSQEWIVICDLMRIESRSSGYDEPKTEKRDRSIQ